MANVHNTRNTVLVLAIVAFVLAFGFTPIAKMAVVLVIGIAITAFLVALRFAGWVLNGPRATIIGAPIIALAVGYTALLGFAPKVVSMANLAVEILWNKAKVNQTLATAKHWTLEAAHNGLIASNDNGGDVVLSIMFPAKPVQASEQVEAICIGVSTHDEVRVHHAPGLTAPVYTTLVAQQDVTVVGTSKNKRWYEVRWHGIPQRHYWVHIQFLRVDSRCVTRLK